MLPLLILYGALALTREMCTVKYYGAVCEGSALLASSLGLVIELLDSTALLVVFMKIVDGWRVQAFIPIIVYGLSGAVGTYLGVRRKN